VAMARQAFSRGSGRALPSRSQRSKTFWELGPGGNDLPTMDPVLFSASSSSILGLGVTPVGQPLTIVRLHGYLELLLATADSSLSGYNWAFGIGVVSADAFGVGVTAVPKPFDDMDWNGWMVHKQGALHTPIAGVADAGFGTSIQSIEIGSKSMRKLNLNEVMFGILQVGEVINATMNARLGSRVLLQVTK